MEYSIVMVVVSGLTGYFWLTLAGAPIAGAIRVSARALHGTGWPAAWPVALGSATLVTATAAATLVMLIIAAPGAGLFAITGPELLFGLKIGAILWVSRAIVFGLPRVAPRWELEIALAAAALRWRQPPDRERFVEEYSEHMFRAGATRRISESALSRA